MLDVLTFVTKSPLGYPHHCDSGEMSTSAQTQELCETSSPLSAHGLIRLSQALPQLKDPVVLLYIVVSMSADQPCHWRRFFPRRITSPLRRSRHACLQLCKSNIPFRKEQFCKFGRTRRGPAFERCLPVLSILFSSKWLRTRLTDHRNNTIKLWNTQS